MSRLRRTSEALEAAMAEAADTAEIPECPMVSCRGRGEGSAEEERSSSSLLDLM